MKYLFFNDYSEGVHPAILDLMASTNLTQENGYGADSISVQASQLIKDAIKNPDACIHFVSGGTQANLIVLSSLMKPCKQPVAYATGILA